MKVAEAPLLAFFANATSTLAFDAYTVTLQSGQVYRWTNADRPLRATDGQVYTLGPVITRDTVRWVRGIQVDELRIQLAADASLVFGGTTLPAFAVAGGFDNAIVSVRRVYLDLDLVVKGQLEWFSGTVADVGDFTHLGCSVTVKSDLQNLDVSMPCNVYQAPCRNQLYGVKCAVNRAAFTVNVGVSNPDAANPRSIFSIAYTGQPSGFFALGICTFTSGRNVGVSRTVKAHQTGAGQSVLTFGRPFPFPIASGDGLAVSAGCDRQFSTCGSKFGNTPRFSAEPFIPAVETAT